MTEIYEIKEGRYHLVDQELGLNLQGPFKAEMRCDFYPSGKLQSECYFLEEQLHGPSVFYSEEGSILSRSWFLFGVQQGKVWQYYLSKKLYSLQRFKDGLREGVQEYYYEDSTLRTRMHYAKGELHGEVLLYFPNGKIKRHLSYLLGKKQEGEKIYNEAGDLVECSS